MVAPVGLSFMPMMSPVGIFVRSMLPVSVVNRLHVRDGVPRSIVGSRGVRAHLGAGRTGISTGAGPFTYYSSFSGGSRTRTSPERLGGPTKAQLARAEKERHFHELHRALAVIVDVPAEGENEGECKTATARRVPFWCVPPARLVAHLCRHDLDLRAHNSRSRGLLLFP